MDAAGGGGDGGAAAAPPAQNAAAPWRRQGSQGGGNASNPSSPAPQASTNPSPPSNSALGPPPPPPPMAPGNAIPSVRLNSEIGPRDTRGPPMAIASAMMKDKKPFTYTPGGIDLSEIRSPRMAKRIQVNAAAEGVSSVPMSQQQQYQMQQQQGLPQQGGPPPPPPPPTYLPPAAMAAMNPAMAIPVLPQGGFNPGNLHRTQKPSDYVRQESDFQSQYQPPHQPQQHPHQPHFLSQQLQQQIQQHQQQRQPQQYHHQQQQQPQTPSNVQTPLPPPPPMPDRSSSSTTGVPIQLMNNVSGRTSTSPERSSGTGSIYIPPLNTTTTPSSTGGGAYSHVVGSSSSPSSHQQQQARPTQQTKAQAHSQNLGSIYIPPIEQRPSVFSERNTSSPSTASTSIDSPTKTPQTPQLNKINPPWMNSYNRIQGQQQGVPQSPNANATPWGTRTIPITIVREDDDNNQATTFQQQQQQSQQPQYSAPPPWRQQHQQQQQHHHQHQQQPVADHGGYAGARIVPIQIETQPSVGGFRDIPIQFEGNVKRGPANQPGTPGGRSSPYNYSTANQAKDAFARQASELSAGVDKISMGDESPRMEPIQSKSFRVIQKITDDGDQQQRKLELAGDDKRLMDEIRAQVDEGSSLHKSSEPRYTGVHIPSRAFRQLQSNLPSGPGAGVQDVTPNYPTQTGPGPVTHNIPIKMVPLSPQSSSQQPPNFGMSQQQQGQQNRVVPPSQQQVAEPKKYTGSSIPSRSFKILQQMTADDDGEGTGTSDM